MLLTSVKDKLRKIFERFDEIFAKIIEKFRKIWKYELYGVWREEAPEASEIIKILVEKSTENCKVSSTMSDSLLGKIIVIKIKVS